MTEIVVQDRPHVPKLTDEEDDEFEIAEYRFLELLDDEYDLRQFGTEDSAYTENIKFRVSLEDKTSIEEAAFLADLSVSEWCRTRLIEIVEQELF